MVRCPITTQILRDGWRKTTCQTSSTIAAFVFFSKLVLCGPASAWYGCLTWHVCLLAFCGQVFVCVPVFLLLVCWFAGFLFPDVVTGWCFFSGIVFVCLVFSVLALFCIVLLRANVFLRWCSCGLLCFCGGLFVCLRRWGGVFSGLVFVRGGICTQYLMGWCFFVLVSLWTPFFAPVFWVAVNFMCLGFCCCKFPGPYGPYVHNSDVSLPNCFRAHTNRCLNHHQKTLFIIVQNWFIKTHNNSQGHSHSHSWSHHSHSF